MSCSWSLGPRNPFFPVVLKLASIAASRFLSHLWVPRTFEARMVPRMERALSSP